MRRVVALAGTALLLTGCGDDLSPEEQAARDERDIALVQQANEEMPPLKQVTPEPLLESDIERFDLLGEVCKYAPGTSLGTRVIAREADAFVKIDGEVERFAADPGARELPLHTRSLYNGSDHSLRLRLDGEGEAAGPEAGAEASAEPTQVLADHEGSVTLFDKYGRAIYEGVGPAECGG